MSDNLWLITLPHAGGSSTIFKGWDNNLKYNVLNLEYPGHWARMQEPLATTFEELEKDVLNSILTTVKANSHVLIFGHSLGAILAWHIAEKFIEYNIVVDGLFLSASQNPGAFPEKKIANASSDIDVLELIGYSYEAHSNAINEQFKKIFLPIIKADLKICRECKLDYSYCPIDSVILYGLEDKFADINEIKKWDKYVKSISIIGLKGKHLYIEKEENRKIIIELINNFIEGGGLG